MKNIILVGDSIRMCYDKYVKNCLRNSANISYPAENCRFAHYVLKHFGEWLDQSGFSGNVDLIHWNAGLHDAVYLYGDEIFTPIEWYADMIERVYKMIKHLAPEAKQVFATSTPVIEEGYTNPARIYRLNSDIKAYNKVAIERLSKYDIVINDLYSTMESAPKECYSDMVHFGTKLGIQTTGNKVLEVICSELNITAEEFVDEADDVMNRKDLLR